MAQKALYGQRIAILVANGFSEQDLIRTQRVVQAMGGDTRIVSMDQGLVNSWNGTTWGLNFAADQALNTSLAADYEILIVPGGERSAEKLKLTAHTRRFMNGFLATGKPVIAANEAVDLLSFTEILEGKTVAGDNDGVVIDGNLLTCRLDDANEGDVADAIRNFLEAFDGSEDQAVAA